MKSVASAASWRCLQAESCARNWRSAFHLLCLELALLSVALALTSCSTPIGAQKTATVSVYRQTHENAVSRSEPGPATLSVLNRFDQVEQFAKAPDASLQLIHSKAFESKDRGLLFALAELNYIVGDRVRHS